MENWKDINGWEGLYQISDHGNVKSLPRKVKGREEIILDVLGCIRKPRVGKCGYYYINLKNSGISKTVKNHRLVAQHFVDGYEDGLVVNHKDGNKLNNHYSNLEWVTLSRNSIHALEIGLYETPKGFNHSQSKTNNAHVLIMRSLSKIGFTNRELSDSFKIPVSHIRRIVKKERWKHI